MAEIMLWWKQQVNPGYWRKHYLLPTGNDQCINWKKYIWASWVCTPLRSRALVNTRRDYKLALARNNATMVNVRYIKIQNDSESYWLFMFIYFLCLCSLRLNIMLNFNISKVVYYSLQKQPLQTVNYALLKAAREFVLFQQQVQFKRFTFFNTLPHILF